MERNPKCVRLEQPFAALKAVPEEGQACFAVLLHSNVDQVEENVESTALNPHARSPPPSIALNLTTATCDSPSAPAQANLRSRELT